MKGWVVAAIIAANLMGVACAPAKAADLTEQQQAILAQSLRQDREGWIILHVVGPPAARGFQQGYRLAPEIARALDSIRHQWTRETGMPWSWAVDRIAQSMSLKLSSENMDELDGMADGMRVAGFQTRAIELVAYNAWFDLIWYWWPDFRKDHPDADQGLHCSAFVATGAMTADHHVVLAQNTHFDFAIAADFNVIVDVRPDQGHHFVMQSRPGWIHSGTDFFVTDAGLVGTETTIGDFSGFDEKGVPEFDRARRAMQYADDLDGFVQIMSKGNNGGYANSWLLANVKTDEIMRFELGLKHVGVERTKDGYFTGSNIASDPKLRIFETDSSDYDISESNIARRERWKQLMAQNRGTLTVDVAKRLVGDATDMFLVKENTPSHRTICARGDLDPGLVRSTGFLPFDPEGAFDGKALDAQMAKRLSFWASWGPPCGPDFVAKTFLDAHTQYDALAPDLRDLVHHPWIEFAPVSD